MHYNICYFTIDVGVDVGVVIGVVIYWYATNSPFLYTLHLNFCLEGVVHTSLFEFTSVINNCFLLLMPYITNPEKNPPYAPPVINSIPTL